MRHRLKRQFLPLILSSITGASAWSSTPALAATAKTSTAHTYKGLLENTHWGPVQVSIVVKNKRITNLKTTTTIETARSQAIQSNALSILKQEILQAQSAAIDQVSGADR